ncbi:MAG: zf-HC2 domain-containing protein [Chloroflexota bacterium]|nr:MAG: zf-HC2 domain-containing protein [Chloroflexota bacterium]
MSISDRELEALSAYLDGELSRKERNRLEANLESNEQLRSVLNQLQQTRGVIRSLPRLRAPRNYILTPEMVGEKEKQVGFFPVLRFASVMATLLLVILFLGDYIMLPSLVESPMRALESQEIAVEESAQLESEAVVEGEPPEMPLEQPMESSEIEPAAESSLGEEMASPSVEETQVVEKLLGTAELPPAEDQQDQIIEDSAPTVGPDLRIQSRETDTQVQSVVQPWMVLRSAVRITEIILVLIAVTTGIAALIFYQKYR